MNIQKETTCKNYTGKKSESRQSNRTYNRWDLFRDDCSRLFWRFLELFDELGWNWKQERCYSNGIQPWTERNVLKYLYSYRNSPSEYKKKHNKYQKCTLDAPHYYIIQDFISDIKTMPAWYGTLSNSLRKGNLCRTDLLVTPSQAGMHQQSCPALNHLMDTQCRESGMTGL